MPSTITCDSCGKEWPEDLELEFCGKCGSSLVEEEEPSEAESAGEEVANSGTAEEFAPEKKKELAESAVYEQERVSPGGELRYATVLFADIKGFTSFSEGRDADEVADTVGTLLERLGATIEEEGGLVDKFIGDAVMATFGLEHADPYAARTAVSTAFRLQEDVQAYVEEVGHEFSLRVGVHAGEVMWKSIGDGFTVMGDTVNTANRIEEEAPPGGVMVSEPVGRILRGRWELEETGSVPLKGKSEPARLYVVNKKRSGQQSSVMTRLPFSGREGEQRLLMDEFQESVQNQDFRFVIVEGETGVGKTRLVRKLKEQVIRENGIWSDNDFEGGGGGTEEGTAQLIRSLFDIRDIEDTQDILDRIVEKIKNDFTWISSDRVQVVKEYMAFMLGVEQEEFEISNLKGEEKLKGAWIVLRNLLERIGSEQPIVWSLENLQKGDPRTIRFLEWCNDAIWTGSVMVVATIRDEEYGPSSNCYEFTEDLREVAESKEVQEEPQQQEGETDPLEEADAEEQSSEVEQETEEEVNTTEEQASVNFIRLEELPMEDLSEALTSSLPGGVDQQLTRRIARHCEGNPLFAVETVVDLFEQDYLEQREDDNTWFLSVPWSEVDFPGTLREVMEARLQKLPRTGIEVAKRGAVMGRRFYLNALEEIWEHSEEKFQSGLGTLENTAMLDIQPSPLSRIGETGIFQHGRFQEAAAARATGKEQREWMSTIASWCGRVISSTSNPEHAGQTLFPLMARAQKKAEQLEEALLTHETAGWLLLKHHRVDDVKVQFRQALMAPSNLDDVDEHRVKAFEDLLSADECPEEDLKERLYMRDAALRLTVAAVEMDLGNLDDALEEVEIVEATLSNVLGSKPQELETPLDLVQIPEQLPGFLKNMDWWDQHPIELLIQMKLLRSNVLEMKGDVEEAEQLIDDAYDQLEEHQKEIQEDRVPKLYSNWMYRKMYCLGDARGKPEKALKIMKRRMENGDGVIEDLDKLPNDERADILHNRANLLYTIGNYHKARKIERKLLKYWQGQNRPEKTATTLNLLGTINVKMADYEQSEPNYREAREHFQKLGKRLEEAKILGNLGNVYLQKGQYQQAKNCFTESRKTFHEAGSSREEIKALGNLGLVFMELGNYDKAEQCFQKQLETSITLDSHQTQVLALGNLGYLYHLRGNLGAAIRSYKKQLRKSKDFGLRYHEGLALGSLAELYRERFVSEESETGSPEEDPPLAYLCTEKALNVADSTGHRILRVHMLLSNAILQRWAAGGFMQDEHGRKKEVVKQGLANLTVKAELEEVSKKEIYSQSKDSIQECLELCDELEVDHTLHGKILLEDIRHKVLFSKQEEAQERFSEIDALISTAEEKGADVSEIREKVQALRSLL